MNTRLQAAIAMAVLGLSAVTVTHKAAACGLDNMQLSVGRHWSLPTYLPSSNVANAVAQTPASGKVSPQFNLLQLLEPLTGMYSATFIAEGNRPPGPPNGTVLDQAFVTWHADGTELMNSESAMGGLCMGVWKQTGAHTYTLNHFAEPFDPVTHAFIGPLNLREDITLAPDNNSYSGSVSYTQFAPDGTTVIPPIVHGVISATRIKP